MRVFIGTFFLALAGILVISCASAPKKVIIADLDPLPAGTVRVGIVKIFPSRVEEVTVPLTFDPRTNMVYIQFSYQTVTYRQYWDGSSRAWFISAVKQYNKDFTARNLQEKKSFRTRGAYGSVKAMTEWGVLKAFINSRAYPRIDMGYIFRDHSPYFLITQRSAENIAVAASSNRNNSLQIDMYFTRTMAEEMAAAFEQDNLLAFLPMEIQETLSPEKEAPPPMPGIVPDSYGAE